MDTNLLLPWHEGFWEIYHSKPPVDWKLKVADHSVVYLAPDPVTGALNYISCPQEYWERESETNWIEESTLDPSADPYADWYPFKEFDEPPVEEEVLFI